MSYRPDFSLLVVYLPPPRLLTCHLYSLPLLQFCLCLLHTHMHTRTHAPYTTAGTSTRNMVIESRTDVSLPGPSAVTGLWRISRPTTLLGEQTGAHVVMSPNWT
ncbi:hypothetical protein F4809DRAFT_118021 [Biscogniauxia mediterranea]|nr:hypothetical protein F4809DRAFT_118021 [Biscogniauxia mediterranea]